MLLHKVIAYITREREGRRELLVFTHRDYPEAGLQVPAGTMHEGERPEEALHREIEEESGLTGLQVVRKLATYDWVSPETGNAHRRNVYHLIAPPDTADEWQWEETSGGTAAEHGRFWFCFRWAPLGRDIELAGNQGDYLGEISA